MNFGEITGQLYTISKADVGMPMRTQFTAKKDERKNVSTLDNNLNIINSQNTNNKNSNFEYFDPEFTNSSSRFQQINKDISLNNPQRNIQNELFEHQLQNISLEHSDYINSLSFNIFNTLCKNIQRNFCIFPIGIINNMVSNDPVVKKIFNIVSKSNIFYQKYNTSEYLSNRAAVVIPFNIEIHKNNINYYEDNNNIVVEYIYEQPSLAFGIICDRDFGDLNINDKMFSSYMANIKKSSVSVYIPHFTISNKINMTETLNNLGYINNTNLQYIQTVYLNFKNSFYVKNTFGKPLIQLKNNFIFYIRYIPNNIILFLGRK